MTETSCSHYSPTIRFFFSFMGRIFDPFVRISWCSLRTHTQLFFGELVVTPELRVSTATQKTQLSAAGPAVSHWISISPHAAPTHGARGLSRACFGG